MKNIIAIQHTQSVQHTNGMIGSWTDWELTELGVEQAKRIGERLSAEICDKDYVMYSSDLLRAKQTAEIVAGFLHIEPVFTESLRERNLGEAVGKSKEWARNNSLVQEKTVDDRAFNGAESRRDVWTRLSNFETEIMSAREDNIIIVSHGDTLSIFNALWLGLDVEMLNKCDLFGQAGGVSFMREDSNGKRIINRMCDLSYIRS